MLGAFAGVSLLVSGPPNLPPWSLVLCVVALTVVCILAAFPCLWSSSTGTWVLFSLLPFLGALTSILSVLVGIVPFTLVKVFLSHFRHLFSSPMFSRAHPLVLSSLVMILLPSSSSTSHSVAGVALPLLPQCTGNLASVMLYALPSDVHSRCSVACVLLTTVLWSLPVCSGCLLVRKVRGRISACLLFSLSLRPASWPCGWVFLLVPRPRHSIGGSPKRSEIVWTVPFATDSPPWCLICMVSLLTSSLTTSSQSGRTPCTPQTFLLLPFVFGVLSVGDTTTPPQAVPLVTDIALPPAPFAMTRTAPSCITFPLALPTTTLELAGLTPVTPPCLKLRRWPNTGCSNPSVRQTRR